MAYEKIVRIKETTKFGRPAKHLDFRGIQLYGKDLKKAIDQSAQHTQKFIIQDFPNWLTLSHKQFVSLLDYTEEMHDTKDRMYIAADERGGTLCVMEVDVDEELEKFDPGEDKFGDDWSADWSEGEEVIDEQYLS